MSGKDSLAEFIMTHEHRLRANAWLYADEMQIYVRKSCPRPLGEYGKLICLDIANVEVYEVGLGTFTDFIQYAHEINPWGATYVECVQEERFGNFLIKQGFTFDLRPGVESRCYYKVK